MTSLPFYKKKGYANSAIDQNQDNNDAQKKEICYTGMQDLGNGFYYIEIFITHQK